MFQVESVQKAFLGRRARLKALGAIGGGASFATEAGTWDIALPDSVAAGDVIDVQVPAFVQLHIGQTLS